MQSRSNMEDRQPSHKWSNHFQLKESSILGITAIGRTTIFLLKLNEPKRLLIRKALISQQLYPS